MNLRVDEQTIWLTQAEIAELFQTTKQNVSLHAQNIFEDQELEPEATVKESLTLQAEGSRQVERLITFYNLDLILAIDFRVRSPCGDSYICDEKHLMSVIQYIHHNPVKAWLCREPWQWFWSSAGNFARTAEVPVGS